MIDLYYWPTPNGWKLTILFEELGIPYNVIPVDINKGEQFEQDFLTIAPNNRMPAVVDSEGADGAPLSLFESGAIMLHYADKHGRFIPADERGRAEVLQWLFFQMGNVGPMLGQCHHFRNYAPEKLPYAIERYVNETSRLYRVVNKAPRGSRLGRRRLFDCRHGDLPVDAALGEPGAGHRRLSRPRQVAGAQQRAPGSAARPRRDV